MNFIKINKTLLLNLKEQPKLLLLICILFILENKENKIFSTINNITEHCGYKPTRISNGISEEIKLLICNLINNNSLITVDQNIYKTSIQNDFSKIKNSELFCIKFSEENDFFNIKTNFIIIDFEVIKNIIKYPIITKNTSSINTANLFNVYSIIKSYIFEHPNRLNYCNPTTKTIAEILELSENTIVKNIKILEYLELLYIYRFDKYNTTNGKIKKMNNAYSTTKYKFEDVKNDIINDKWTNST
jgi:hypothetical protein